MVLNHYASIGEQGRVNVKIKSMQFPLSIRIFYWGVPGFAVDLPRSVFGAMD